MFAGDEMNIEQFFLERLGHQFHLITELAGLAAEDGGTNMLSALS
jgi:hypothetical protein